MNAHHAPGDERDIATELPDGPGRRLRIARQARGLELEQVAAELHLSTSVIESLEHDDHEALPSRVFVLGYIRKYAGLVGLDPEPLLDSYRSAMPPVEPAHASVVPHKARQDSNGRLLFRLVSVGILILLAALLFQWWQDLQPGAVLETTDLGAKQETEEERIPESIPESQTLPASGADLTVVPDDGQPIESELQSQTITHDFSATPAAVEQQPIAVGTTEESATESTDNKPIDAVQTDTTDSEQDVETLVTSEAEDEEPTVTNQEIVMSFDGPCWVDIRDSKRKYKLFGEMKKGDRRVLEGKPPYSVILGNAVAVRITVGGTPFDLSSLSKGNVARFTLDPLKDHGPKAEIQGHETSALGPTP